MEKNNHDPDVVMLGRYSQGIKTGTHWWSCEGGGFLVGDVDDGDKCDGGEAVFIYPDHLSVIVGHWSRGVMVSGQFGDIVGVRRELGIIIPEVHIHPDSPTYCHDPASSSLISRSPMVRDLYEARHVMVDKSSVPGTRVYFSPILKFYNNN